jgi:hypothetical protein
VLEIALERVPVPCPTMSRWPPHRVKAGESITPVVDQLAH